MKKRNQVKTTKKPEILKKKRYVASPSLGCNVTSESICGSNIQVP